MDAWPAESTNRSRSGQEGSAGQRDQRLGEGGPQTLALPGRSQEHEIGLQYFIAAGDARADLEPGVELPERVRRDARLEREAVAMRVDGSLLERLLDAAAGK